MGKSKQNRFKSNKTSPTGLPSVKEFEQELENLDEVSSKNDDFVVSNLIDKLQSTSEADRDCACNTLACLVSQDEAIPMLMKHNVIKILAPLIVDPSLQLQKSASGALRNLSVDGGDRVCQTMLDNDVMTAVVQWVKTFDFFRFGEKKADGLMLEVANNVIQLLWNLCESCSLGLDIFNKEDLIKNIVPFLQHTEHIALAVSAAQCIHAVSEDNKQLQMYLRTDEPLSILRTLCSSSANSTEHALLRTLATGILLNVFDSCLASAPGELILSMTASISDVLSVDVAAMLQTKLQDISPNSIPSADAIMLSVDSFKAELEDKLSEVDNILNAQLIAIQTAANICCSDDDDEWEELDSESFSSDDIASDVQMEENGDSNYTPLCVPSELNGAIIQSDIMPKVLSKITHNSININREIQSYKKVKNVQKQITQLEIDALLCVNNMLGAVDMESSLGLEQLHSLWERLIQIATGTKAKENTDLLEASMSAMRAVIQKLAEKNSPKFTDVSSNDIEFIYNLAKNSSSREVRVHSVRIVSTIGCLLAKNTQLNPLLKVIGVFLIEVCGCDTDLWVVAEALDSIFDVFGEDHLDPVVKETDMLARLNSIVPSLKSKMSSAKKSLGEHYPVVMTARTNLLRFLKYKASNPV